MKITKDIFNPHESTLYLFLDKILQDSEVLEDLIDYDISKAESVHITTNCPNCLLRDRDGKFRDIYIIINIESRIIYKMLELKRSYCDALAEIYYISNLSFTRTKINNITILPTLYICPYFDKSSVRHKHIDTLQNIIRRNSLRRVQPMFNMVYGQLIRNQYKIAKITEVQSSALSRSKIKSAERQINSYQYTSSDLIELFYNDKKSWYNKDINIKLTDLHHIIPMSGKYIKDYSNLVVLLHDVFQIKLIIDNDFMK